MTKHRMPDIKEGNVNVTPLIDIVMCLIIFYMLVARIGVDTGLDREITQKLPDSMMGADIKDPVNTVNLNVKAYGNGTLISAYDPAENAARDFTPVTLVPFLKQLRAGNPDLKAIIRADKEMTYFRIQDVLVACANANVKEYDFEAKKPQ